MEIDRDSRKNCIRGATIGAQVWFAYWILESTINIVIPLFSQPRHAYLQFHWSLLVILLTLYLLVGSLTGLLGGLLSRNSGSDSAARAAWLSSTGALFLAQFAHRGFQFRFSEPFFWACLGGYAPLLIVQLARFLRSWDLPETVRTGLDSPLTTSIMVLGIPAFLVEYGNLNRMSLAELLILELALFPSVALCTGLLVSRTPAGRLQNRPLRQLVAGGMLVLLFLAINTTPSVSLEQDLKSPPLTRQKVPNIILITMDTVRADHLSLYGYARETDANLVQFSRSATVYQQAMASGAFTLPSHASLFTGLYSSWHGAHYAPPDRPEGRPLDGSFTTLAEFLSQQGYRTHAVVSNWGYLNPDFGMTQGFHSYNYRRPVAFFDLGKPYGLRRTLRDNLEEFLPAAVSDVRFRRAEAINQDVFEILNREETDPEDRPLFLFINYMDAHWPLIPPHPFDTQFPGKDADFTLTDYFRLRDRVLISRRPVSQRERTHLISQYDGGIAYIDHHLGSLFERFRKLELFEDSLIIVTSDHGDAFGERDFVDHGVSVYQDQVWVPLIIKYPGQTDPIRVSDFVSHVDLFPTIQEFVSSPEERLQGQSLLRLAGGRKSGVLSETYPRGFVRIRRPRLFRIQQALFHDGYKLVRSTGGKRELYNLSRDSLEENDLWTLEQQVADSLEARLNQLYTSRPAPRFKSPSNVGRKAFERLRSLGYIQ